MKSINKKNEELLEYIKKTDKMGLPRLQAFANFANKHNLKCETVRNLYYHLVRENKLQKEFKIEHCSHFTQEELDVVMRQIVNELNQSKSVRSACYKVSKGDAKMMLRLQNKFRSLLKSNRQYLMDLGLKFEKKNISFLLDNPVFDKSQLRLKNDAIYSKNAHNAVNYDGLNTKNDKIVMSSNSKVLRMPNNNILTDADINNLFMGLVRMVKRNAIENAPMVLKNECDLANASLKDALVKLGASTRKLEIIKCENYELKKRLEDSERLLQNARCEVVELLNRIDSAGKIEDLKKFLQEYKKNGNKDNLKVKE